MKKIVVGKQSYFWPIQTPSNILECCLCDKNTWTETERVWFVCHWKARIMPDKIELIPPSVGMILIYRWAYVSEHTAVWISFAISVWLFRSASVSTVAPSWARTTNEGREIVIRRTGCRYLAPNDGKISAPFEKKSCSVVVAVPRCIHQWCLSHLFVTHTTTSNVIINPECCVDIVPCSAGWYQLPDWEAKQQCPDGLWLLRASVLSSRTFSHMRSGLRAVLDIGSDSSHSMFLAWFTT